MFTRIPGFHLSEHEVQRHVGLLVGQAILLVLLALVYIGFEAYTVNIEAQVPKHLIQNRSRVEYLAQRSALMQNLKQKDEKAVLGANEMKKLLIDASKVSEEDKDIFLQKESYVIALTGDSIIETMGKDAPYLKKALEKKYPDTHFFIYNYAKGARNVNQNLKDFHEPFHYKDRHYESIDDLKPDIIIVAGSSYNLFEPHDTNTHWLAYTRLIEEAIKVTPHVYMLAEQAPLANGFGAGQEGATWTSDTAWIHTGRIIEQIKNVLGLAKTLEIPVIDLYTPSLDEGGQRGKRELISTADNIHLSEKGYEFAAQEIVKAINFEEIR